MKHDLKAPCGECPFRRSSTRGWIGPYDSPEELLHVAVTMDQPFPCHLTMGGSCTDDDDANAEESYCVGTLRFFANTGKLSRDRQRPREEKDPRVFKTHAEFLEHHKPFSQAEPSQFAVSDDAD